MKTLFSALLSRLGLSQSEAADFFSVRKDTVKSWSADRNAVPNGVWAEARRLARKQQAAAEAVVSAWREARHADVIEVACPSSAELERRGWPCEGAFLAAVAQAWAMLPDGVHVRLVEPGSTVAAREAERIRKLTES